MAEFKTPPKHQTLGDIIRKLPIAKAAQESLDEWNRQSDTIKVLVTGKTGTGKSTLINAIVGETVAEEGGSLDLMTSVVTEYIKTVGDTTVKILDSPGLQDGTEHEDEYLEDIKKKCCDVHLMVYCIRMSETRFLPGNKDAIAMKKFSSALGQKIWQNSLIVLTFANDILEMAELNTDTDKEKNAYYFKALDDWTSLIHKFMATDLKLPSDIVEKVPVVPASLFEEPTLPDRCSNTLSGNWLSGLWLKALEVTALNGQPALIRLNTYRIKQKPQEYMGKTEYSIRKVGNSVPLVFYEKGAIRGEAAINANGNAVKMFFARVAKRGGGLLGYSFGVTQSLRLFLELGLHSNRIEEESLL